MENGSTILNLLAVAGTVKNYKSKSHQQQERLIKKIVVYDNDFHNNFRNSADMALLKTFKPFKLNGNVKLVKWGHNVNYNEMATIFGWGRTLKNSVAEILQKKDLTLIPREKCKEMLQKSSSVKLKDYEICTIESPCFGDSGGPLVQQINGEQTIVGIASWTFDNCVVPPTVFVLPGYFDAWLKDNIKRLN